MKIKYLLLTIGLFASQSMRAQLSSENFFISFSSSIYLDIVKTPLGTVPTFIGTNPDGSKAYADAPTQSMQISTYSFGIEPRYNVATLNNDAAVALAIPFSIGLGGAGATNEYVRGVSIQSFGSIQVPVIAKFYYGNSSTYDTEKDFGFSLGGGLEYNQIGLFGGNEDDKAAGLHKGFILPVVSASLHFWRGNSPFEVNMKYGTTSVKEYRIDSFGQPLRNPEGDLISRSAKGSSFKLTFLYLLNY